MKSICSILFILLMISQTFEKFLAHNFKSSKLPSKKVEQFSNKFKLVKIILLLTRQLLRHQYGILFSCIEVFFRDCENLQGLFKTIEAYT